MPKNREYGLNRIMSPHLSVTEFIRLASDCGAKYVEIRNDLPDPSLLGGETAGEINDTCQETNVSILTVNALQRFNDPALFEAKKEELQGIMEVAASVGCERIVLCPVNDPDDTRTAEQQHADLVSALVTYAPLFRTRGMIGLVEPLGFPICSLRYKGQAVQGISESGHRDVYRIVHDSFHHYLSGEAEVFPLETGLVHVSGVVVQKPTQELTDDDRVLVDEHDIMANRSQVAMLRSGGSSAEVCFEPFSSEMQQLTAPDLKARLKRSVEFLFGP